MMPFYPDGHGHLLGVVLSVRLSGALADKSDKGADDLSGPRHRATMGFTAVMATAPPPARGQAT
jgi:hypothetical protein